MAELDSNGWHRHVRSWVTFEEHVRNTIEEKPGRFEYCDICKCVPTALIARNENSLVIGQLPPPGCKWKIVGKWIDVPTFPCRAMKGYYGG